MNKLLTLPDVVQATGGRLFWPTGGAQETTTGAISPGAPSNIGPSSATAVASTLTTTDVPEIYFLKAVYDSRQAEPGSLFVALPGENTDGHKFLEDAIAKGASAAIVRQDWLEAQPAPLPIPCVAVPATLPAFQQLAGWWRGQYRHLNVTGITGSVGKTSTKELLASVLEQRFNVFKSPKSFNNEYSLMPVLLQLQPENQQAVIEMGAGWEFGELRRVCEVVKPSIGVELGVSHSHVGRMGTLENLARNKAELVESLPANGWAVLNGDDTRVKAMARVTPAQVFFYGTDPGFDLWASEIESFGLEGIALNLHYRGETHHLRLPLRGRHSAQTVLAATAVALLCGLSWEEIEAGLNKPEAQVRLLVKPGLKGSTVIDDSYNASAVSVVAALDLVADTPVQGRKLALLGDMLELGDYTEEAHRIVGRRAAQVLNHLVVVGELARTIGEEAINSGMDKTQVTFAQDKPGAAIWLQENLQPGDLLLVKASRGVALEEVVQKVSAGNA